MQGEVHGARTTKHHSASPLPPVSAENRGAPEHPVPAPHRPILPCSESTLCAARHSPPSHNRTNLLFINERRFSERIKQRNWRLAINSSTSFQSFRSDQSLQDYNDYFFSPRCLTENHKLQFCPWEHPSHKWYILALPVYLADKMCTLRAFLTSVNFRVAIIFNYSRWKTTQNVNSSPPSPKAPCYPWSPLPYFFPSPTPKRLDLLFLTAHISWCDHCPCHTFFSMYTVKKILSSFRTF